MIELDAAPRIAPPAAPRSSHVDAPRWWQEWIAQVLAAAATRTRPSMSAPGALATPRAMHGRASLPPQAEFAAGSLLEAVHALREAQRALREAEARADEDAFALAIARQQLFVARRAWQARVEQAGAPGVHWCLCALEAAAPR